MKTPYLNELIEKLQSFKKEDILNNEGEDGLKELIEVKRVLNLHIVVRQSEQSYCSCLSDTLQKPISETEFECFECGKETKQ